MEDIFISKKRQLEIMLQYSWEVWPLFDKKWLYHLTTLHSAIRLLKDPAHSRAPQVHDHSDKSVNITLKIVTMFFILFTVKLRFVNVEYRCVPSAL